MTNHLIVTIIVHYNVPDECLNLICELEECNVPNHKIIISDNNSSQENLKKLEKGLQKKSALFIKNKNNKGFGAGVNAAFIEAKKYSPDYIHVINTDVKIINKTYIQELTDFLNRNSSIGIIGAAVLSEDKETIQNTIMHFPSLKHALFFKKFAKNLSFIKNPPELIECDVINGVCFIMRANIFERIKGFDEEYFMYGEEHDLCYKVKKINFSVVFYSIPSIIHYGSVSFSTKTIDWRYFYHRINQVYFMRKKNSYLGSFILRILFLFSLLIKRYISGYKVKNNAFSASLIGFSVSIRKGKSKVVL